MSDKPNQQPPQGGGQQRQMQIKIPENVLAGPNYANSMRVMHTKDEFTIDFINIHMAEGVGVVTNRVKTSPGHMKRVLTALQENIKRYESNFGKIEEAEAPPHEVGFKG
ncbi:DUF3467 domain-containing protein [Patescibacteria group bacterium]|nr:DUF3467 domain-containing protein [Patescibacteria group bacterium]MBU1951291.1 DUF3467 domain-containing protein [Patescibacteria group bacterium]